MRIHGKNHEKEKKKTEQIVCSDLHSDIIVPSQDVDSIFHHESFGVVLDPCIAAKG